MRSQDMLCMGLVNVSEQKRTAATLAQISLTRCVIQIGHQHSAEIHQLPTSAFFTVRPKSGKRCHQNLTSLWNAFE